MQSVFIQNHNPAMEINLHTPFKVGHQNSFCRSAHTQSAILGLSECSRFAQKLFSPEVICFLSETLGKLLHIFSLIAFPKVKLRKPGQMDVPTNNFLLSLPSNQQSCCMVYYHVHSLCVLNSSLRRFSYSNTKP